MTKAKGYGESRFEQLAGKYIEHPQFQRMKQYRAHGRITVYEHSLAVAGMCSQFLKPGSKLNESDLIAGALLHDFYLYDWHEASIRVPLFRMHGFTHPLTASENALKIFGINKKVQSIIRTHMWPLTLTRIPACREGWIVCLCDKLVAIRETFTR